MCLSFLDFATSALESVNASYKSRLCSNFPQLEINAQNRVMLVQATTNHQLYHKMVDEPSNKTLLGAMYKLCLICLMETLSIIRDTLHQVVPAPSENKKKLTRDTRAIRPPMPSRTRSRVIRVNRKWIKQSSIHKNHEAETQNTRRPRSRSTSSFGRFLNISRRFLCRRHSYPPYVSKLERVIEEDERSI